LSRIDVAELNEFVNINEPVAQTYKIRELRKNYGFVQQAQKYR